MLRSPLTVASDGQEASLLVARANGRVDQLPVLVDLGNLVLGSRSLRASRAMGGRFAQPMT